MKKIKIFLRLLRAKQYSVLINYDDTGKYSIHNSITRDEFDRLVDVNHKNMDATKQYLEAKNFNV